MRGNKRKVDEEIANAIAAYQGTIVELPPGTARAASRQVKPGKSAQWLQEHRHDLREIDAKARLKRKRKVRQERARIASRNALLMKRISK